LLFICTRGVLPMTIPFPTRRSSDLDANAFDRSEISYQQHMIFCQVYDAFTASEVKLTLLEDLPADYEITIVEAAGTANEKKTNIPLEQLDRLEGISNL